MLLRIERVVADALRPSDAPAQVQLRADMLAAYGVARSKSKLCVDTSMLLLIVCCVAAPSDDRLKIDGLQPFAEDASVAKQQCLALLAMGTTCDSNVISLIAVVK